MWKFLFGVRMIFGPDIASLLLTTFLIVAPAIAFCVKVYLQIKKNDDFSHEFWFPVVVVGAVLTVLVNTIGILFPESLHKLVVILCIFLPFSLVCCLFSATEW
ncbi:hypothetical protein V8G54_018480 [Vigna mungo]|uniref:Uncharacterized protein n=1 Tax=Vigna mungo TaxID=3915 RepID=A0AAQ3RUN1_VIGMU